MLLLIPPCVALVDYLDIIGKDFWAITISTISSTILVLIISAQVHTYSRKRQNK
ncbi:CidA/LrgA family protein [Suttonella ornithocola]|uniref:CidA/LrgA family protein n=1 Tax=Suttonella ornithocola TaxID=279832 RepID=UPI001FE9A16D